MAQESVYRFGQAAQLRVLQAVNGFAPQAAADPRQRGILSNSRMSSRNFPASMSSMPPGGRYSARSWVLPRGLGPDRGLRLLRRAGHRSQQHDPDGPGGGGGLPGADPCPHRYGRACRYGRDGRYGPAGRGNTSRDSGCRDSSSRDSSRDGARRDSSAGAVAAYPAADRAPDPGGGRVRRRGHAGHRDHLGGGDHRGRRGTDGDGPGQRQRRPDHRPGDRRQRRPARPQGAGLHADRPVRPASEPGRPARQGGAAHLPRPGSAPATAR